MDWAGKVALSATTHDAKIRDACARHGIEILTHGVGFRLVGTGIDFVVADLTRVHDSDLVARGAGPGTASAYQRR